MTSGGSHNLWKEEQAELERIFLEMPDVLLRPGLPDPDLYNSRIGIFGLDSGRPKGYLRYMPHDFIVEEVETNGEVVSVNPSRSMPDAFGEETRTLYCNLIKVNLSTLAAITYIAEALHLDPSTIGYAGIKDAVAVTAQRISLRGVSWPAIADKKIPNVLLEPVRYGSGVVERGALSANQFTILVRSDGNETTERLRFLIDTYNRIGFSNYYGPQRFGNRFEGHKIGCLLARGDMDGAIKTLLVDPGPNDLPLYRQIRQKMAASYGDWRAMKSLTDKFPHTFQRERAVLERLATDSHKTHQALRAIPDPLRLYIRGYASWITNRYLSRAMQKNETPPEEIPLPLSERAEDRAFYADLFAEDGVSDPMGALQPFSAIVNFRAGTIPSRIFPKIHRVTKVDEGVVFAFTLPKAAYATTYLIHLYRLYEGLPVPGWVRTMDVDVKAAVRMGSLDQIRKIFASELVHRELGQEEEVANA